MISEKFGSLSKQVMKATILESSYRGIEIGYFIRQTNDFYDLFEKRYGTKHKIKMMRPVPENAISWFHTHPFSPMTSSPDIRFTLYNSFPFLIIGYYETDKLCLYYYNASYLYGHYHARYKILWEKIKYYNEGVKELKQLLPLPSFQDEKRKESHRKLCMLKAYITREKISLGKSIKHDKDKIFAVEKEDLGVFTPEERTELLKEFTGWQL